MQYGLEHDLYSLMGIVITLIFGELLEVFVESLIFLVAFISLRIYVGEYHASTRMKCSIVCLFLAVCGLVKIGAKNAVVKGKVDCVNVFHFGKRTAGCDA